MAHRLLTNVFWAGIEYGPGLPAGDQIPGLSLSDEAGLVSSNRAVYTSPPPVINNGLPVLWVPNPDGGNRISGPSGQFRVPSSLRAVAAVNPVGYIVLSSSAITRHALIFAPGVTDAIGYRVRVDNVHTAAVTYTAGVKVHVPDAVGDGVYGDKAWDTLTFGGAAAVTVPAATGATPAHVAGLSDIVARPLPTVTIGGVVGTLFAVRMHGVTNASRNRYATLSTPTSSPAGLLARLEAAGVAFAYNTVDCVTDPAQLLSIAASASGTAGQTADGGPPVSIEIFSAASVRRIALFGASTISGQGDASNNGFVTRAMQAVAAAGLPVSVYNESMPSSPTAACFARANTALVSGAYDAVGVSVFSVNDSTAADWGTSDYLPRIRKQMDDFCQAANALGIRPVLITFQPLQNMTDSTANQYSNCRYANAYARSLSAVGLCDVLDIANVLTDETAATGTWRNAAWTGDGTHPNTAGHTALVDHTVAVFRQI